MIRIVICDDQDVIREGMKAILGVEESIDVIGTARDGEDVLEVVKEAQPDLVLMDLKMPHMNGIQATRILKERYPELPILVLTTYDDEDWIFDAIQSGASGYLLKDTHKDALVKAIQEAAEGKTPIDPNIGGKLFNRLTKNPVRKQSRITENLNEREILILKYLGKGYSNAEIASRMYLSEGTIRNYVSGLLQKLNVSDRIQAAVLALRYGLVDINEE